MNRRACPHCGHADRLVERDAGTHCTWCHRTAFPRARPRTAAGYVRRGWPAARQEARRRALLAEDED